MMTGINRWLKLALLLAWLPVYPVFGAPTKIRSGHMPAVVARLSPIGRLAATNCLNLAIGLPLRNQAALHEFLHGLYDPGSTNYHHYLTPREFTKRFGPTEQDYRSLIQFAQSNGMFVTHTHDNRMLLDVRGKVADIEKALHVTLRIYRHPTEARDFFAPDTEPSVEGNLPVLDISGLSDYARPRPLSRVKPAGGSVINGGSSPGGGFLGSDFRNAYAPGTPLDGFGQMVGLLQFNGYDPNDIFAYEAQAGLPNVPLQNVLIDGADGEPGPAEWETCLDIEMTISMAPNLAAVVVFEAPPPSPMNISSFWNDILNTMVASNQIKQFSASWGYAGNPNATSDQIYQQMAAQGQSFFQASGDGDAWIGPIMQPAESPFVTVVGGTTLVMDDSGTNYNFEAVWNSGYLTNAFPFNGNGYWGSGGGVSGNYSIPDWQTNVDMSVNLGSTNLRNIPDVAMTADNVYVTHGSGTNGIFMGTSCAAPLWAGFTALINQRAASLNQPPVGFLNPAIYALGSGTNYAAGFHDVIAGSNTWSGSPNEYYAVPGYDLCTGWGTPAGTNLINALAGPPDPLDIFPLAGFTATGAVGGPFNGAAQIFSLNNLGTNALNWSLINTSAWLVVAPTSGCLVPGCQTNILICLAPAANALPVGNYSTSIFFTNETAQTAQPRWFTVQVGQSLVQDGGFESGTFSYWKLFGDTIAGNFIFNAVKSPAAGFDVANSGNFGAFLGDTQFSILSQTLPTVPGQSYLLSFWLNNPVSGATQQFGVNWNTNAATNTIFYALNPPSFDWTNFTFVLTAADTNTTLQFGAESDPANSNFGLDDVSVVPIPTPLAGLVQTTNGMMFALNTLAGISYLLQSKTNLLQPDWLDLGSAAASSNSMQLLDTNSLDAVPQRFYRVILIP